MKALTMNDIDLTNKRVIIRCDLNVPLKDGVITGDKRIRAVLPTLKNVLEKNCSIILISHLGRPQEGIFEEKFSLAPVAKRLTELLEKPVRFHAYDPELRVSAKNGEIVLLENIRFLQGEKKNSPELGAKLAQLGDVYIMDAFGAAHRAHASTESAITEMNKKEDGIAIAGPLMEAEMQAATKILQTPTRPLYAIVGGSKVSTKLTVLENLLGFVDGLIVAGGIANTFLKAQGYQVGRSLVEDDFLSEATRLLELAKERNIAFPLPTDVIVAKSMDAPETARTTSINTILEDEAIFDIGKQTCEQYAHILKDAQTIVWNGPLGVFEIEAFETGTKTLGNSLAKHSAYTLACGGDCVSAIEKFELQKDIDYLSTGGGAFLEVLEGKILPAVAALEQCAYQGFK